MPVQVDFKTFRVEAEGFSKLCDACLTLFASVGTALERSFYVPADVCTSLVDLLSGQLEMLRSAHAAEVVVADSRRLSIDLSESERPSVGVSGAPCV